MKRRKKKINFLFRAITVNARQVYVNFKDNVFILNLFELRKL